MSQLSINIPDYSGKVMIDYRYGQVLITAADGSFLVVVVVWGKQLRRHSRAACITQDKIITPAYTMLA
jgi:hypothetical protein